MATSIISSIVTGGTNTHATTSEEANATATDFITQGVLGTITNTTGIAPTAGSFGVNQNTGSDMAISILGTGNTTNGQSIAYVSVTPSSQAIQVLRARMSSNYTAYAINSNSSGSTKYDWIYLMANATNANVPDSAADNVFTIFTSRSSSNTADNGSPPTYGIPLAIVTVANGATSIVNANITDKRTQLVFTGTGVLSAAQFSNPYKFYAYRSASLTLSGITLITSDAEIFDTGTNYSTSTGRFTAPVAGYYQFNASFITSVTGTNELLFASLYKNGSEILRGSNINSGGYSDSVGIGVVGLLKLAANDYVQFYVFTGTSLSAVTGPAFTYFQGYLVSVT